MIIFELTMPGVGSWNGKFSGSDRIYAKCYKNCKIPKDIIDKDFYYNFGDGWCANVSVTKVDSLTCRNIMKKSKGFMGYDWMIDSIIKNKEILKPSSN